ncbi:MAG TPA: hypothetical protein ENG03_03575 [Thioploca sp.]|nr:hypothetical protein [Thioploca sp.]
MKATIVTPKNHPHFRTTNNKYYAFHQRVQLHKHFTDAIPWLGIVSVLTISHASSTLQTIGGLHSANFFVASYQEYKANLVRKNVVLIEVNINN